MGGLFKKYFLEIKTEKFGQQDAPVVPESEIAHMPESITTTSDEYIYQEFKIIITPSFTPGKVHWAAWWTDKDSRQRNYNEGDEKNKRDAYSVAAAYLARLVE